MKLLRLSFIALICIALALALMITFAPASQAAGNLFHFPVGSPDSLTWKVTQAFNARSHGKYHTGVDLSIAQANGKPVYATAAGTVVYTGYANGWGNVIVIKHKLGKANVYSLYGHLSKRLVTRKGTVVRARQQIGNVGNTGNSTGPHLHFEIKSQTCVNRLGLLGPGYTSRPAQNYGYCDPISFIKRY